jgi:hypothetical protein
LRVAVGKQQSKWCTENRETGHENLTLFREGISTHFGHRTSKYIVCVALVSHKEGVRIAFVVGAVETQRR